MTNEELRALALAATPGEWRIERGDDDGPERWVRFGNTLEDSSLLEERDAQFIVAAQPVRVLALLDALAAKDAETERLKARVAAYETRDAQDDPETFARCGKCHATFARYCGRCKAFVCKRCDCNCSPPAPASAGEPGKRCETCSGTGLFCPNEMHLAGKASACGVPCPSCRP